MAHLSQRGAQMRYYLALAGFFGSFVVVALAIVGVLLGAESAEINPFLAVALAASVLILGLVLIVRMFGPHGS